MLFGVGHTLVAAPLPVGLYSSGAETEPSALVTEPVTRPVDEQLSPAAAAELAEGEPDKPMLPAGVPVADPVFARPPQAAPQAAVEALAPASTPVIDIWYGQNQSFGQLGNPQRWINILGNVQDSAGIASLVYSLNGGPPQSLSLGPDTRRLAEPGDFAVELDTQSLPGGVHQVVLTATNVLGNHSVQVVQLNYQPGNTWALPYTADWGTATNIQQIAQVVDGQWAIQDNMLRPLVFAYDRLVAIGDNTWTDYEVTVPVIIHSIDANGFRSPSNGPGVGILARWTGHYQETNEQPRMGWRNLGALAWFRWSRSNNEISVGQQMVGFANSALATRTDLAPQFGVLYTFKLRVESNPGAGATYRFKHWPANGDEPAEWDMTAQGRANEPPTGSVMLVAHHVDASFGAVTVTPLEPARHTLTVNTVGNGTVARIPDLPDYPHGQYVRLPATGAPGHMLGSWSGGLTGNANPAALTLTAARDVTATFIPAVELASDSFNRCQQGDGPWDFVDPLGDSSLAFDGTRALITTPGGIDHDAGAGIYTAPRLLQVAPSGDFELEVKFDSIVNTSGQAQGVLIEQDVNNLLRFDFRRDTATRVYIGRIIDGSASDVRRTIVPVDHPRYMRVSRVGNQWTQMYSLDGINWSLHHSFAQALTVNKVGLFAANTGGAAAPAHSVAIDYFVTSTAPIHPEDPGLRPVLNVVGNGAILLHPDQQHYTCGQVITVTAAPAPGWNFANWSGSLSGTTNPAPLVISGEQIATAIFSLTTHTLTTSVNGSGTITVDPLKVSYTHGESVTVAANAADGWLFTGWGGTLSGSVSPVTLVMNSSHNIVANFVAATPTPTFTPTNTSEPDITATLPPTPPPTATVEAEPDATATDTATLTLTPSSTATPNATNTVSLGTTPAATDDPDPGTTPSPTGEPDPDETPAATAPSTPPNTGAPTPTGAATPDPGSTVTPTAPPTATQTAGASAPSIVTTVGGRVIQEPPGPTYATGQIVTLTAVPDTGWIFVRWEVRESTVGSIDQLDTPTIQVVIPDIRVYQAIFALADAGYLFYLPVISTR
ncbi:MAG: hypothetical protein DCC55_14775 [Chloroflexi bacterium]|nr:MAG: hypothetical protein DCC55_14775 [Chloroflexota bacterium]